MPLPEDETSWAEMYVFFATSRGGVRRNRLSDFTHIMANGKIAMKLEPADGHLVAVRVCSEDDDVLLATARGKCIRFSVTDVRVFSGRTSTGVRGIRLLSQDDEVISMTILHHAELATEARDAYLRYAAAKRRGENGDEAEAPCAPEEFGVDLPEARLAELEAGEQFILSVAQDGLGKRTSAYEYRITGRGGQGIGNMDLTRPGGRQPRVVGAFPVNPGDQLGAGHRCRQADPLPGSTTSASPGARPAACACSTSPRTSASSSVARLADDGETNGTGEVDGTGEANEAGDANGDGGDNPIAED